MQNITFVVPCYNEDETYDAMLAKLNEQRKKIISTKEYKVKFLFINDGSIDSTLDKIIKSTKKNPHVYYVSLDINAGHQSALRAGIAAASNSDAIIMLDADLQHPPELSTEMIAKWEEGYSVVQMVRSDSTIKLSLLKRTTSNLFYKALRILSGIKLEAGASDFRLIDGKLARQLANSPEKKLFLRGYFATLPTKRISIDYQPSPRFAGQSKYTPRKMLDLAKQGILQFSDRPLYISIILGLLSAAAGLIYGFVVIYIHFFSSSTVSGWSSLIVSMLFLFGINFILIGTAGLYLGQSIRVQKQRPEYFISSSKLPK